MIETLGLLAILVVSIVGGLIGAALGRWFDRIFPS